MKSNKLILAPIVLILLIAVAIAMLGVSASLPVAHAEEPADADGDGIFDANTAEYTFATSPRRIDYVEEWGMTYYRFPWMYDSETNTWSNGAHGLNTPAHETLQLNITQSGILSFEIVYKAFSTYMDEGCSLYRKDEPKFERWSSEEFPTSSEIFNFEVETDDVVVLYISNGSNDSYNDFEIRGLKKPQADFTNKTINFTAKAAANGTVQWNEQKSETITGTFDYNSKQVVTAVANEGYGFSCWKDQYGNIVSQDMELELRKWDETYTAEFVEVKGFEFNSDEWEYHDDGNYYITTAAVASGKKTVDLNYTFNGEKRIAFDYGMTKYASDFYVYLDDEKMTTSSQIENLAYHTSFPENAIEKWIPTSITAKGNRAHKLTIRFNCRNAAAYGAIHNLREEVPSASEEFTFNFNEEFADVYIAAKNDVADKGTWAYALNKEKIVDESNKIENGVNLIKNQWYVVYAIEKAKEIPSKLVSGKQAGLQFDGFYFGDEMVPGSSMTNSDDRLGYAFTMIYDGERVLYRYLSNGEFGESSETALDIKFSEKAPTPDVSMMITEGGVTNPERVLKNDETIDLIYGQTNSIKVVLPDFGVQENYLDATIFDGKSLQENGIKVQADVDKLYFSLPNIQLNKDLSISYSVDGYANSEPFVVHFRMQPPFGDLSDNLHYFGDFTVEDGGSWNSNNHGTAAWEFAPEFYDNNNSRSAYRALNYSRDGAPSYSYVSNLKLSFTGPGTLSFEIQMKGYGQKNNWLLYNFDNAINKQPTTSGAGSTSGSNFGGKVLLYSANTGYDTVTKSVDDVTLEPLADNWYSVSVSMESLYGSDISEGQQITFYLAYGIVNNNGLDNGEFVIRNIGYSQGEEQVTYDIKGDSAGGTVKATLGEKEYTSGADITIGSRLNLDVELNGDYEFYAWVDGENNVLSFSQKFSYFVDDSITIYAIIAKTGTYKLRIDGNYYATLKDALAQAKANDKIIIVRDYTLSTNEGTLEIPKDISVIVALDDEGTYYVEGGTVDRVVWETEQNYQYRKRIFTIDSGVTLNVSGAIYVGGTLHRPNQTAQAHTSGNYAELVLNGSIVVKNGGKFDTNGRVTGEGGITIENGGELYQPFLILDFSGGTNTSGLFMFNQTPFSRYAMVNIQCAKGYKIEYGGVLYGHASLYAMSTYTTIDQPFISYSGQNAQGVEGTISLINLKKSGSYAQVVYDNKHQRPVGGGNTEDIGKTTITLYGGATAGFMTFPFDITTQNVHFSIPYNYQLELESGDYEMLYDYKMMPGSSLWVKSGATLTLNADLFVYDGFYSSDMSGKNYPFAEALVNAGYSANANLIVDGELIIGDRIVKKEGEEYVTFLGVIQTNEEGAKITVDQTAVLSGTIIDGGLTNYDCNYASFESSARVYDAAHNRLSMLEQGKSYTSTSYSGKWELPALTIKYARNCKPNEPADSDFPSIAAGLLGGGRAGHLYDTIILAKLEINGGSWKLADHDEGSQHDIDWTPNEKDGYSDLSAETLHKLLSRQCSVMGCDHTEEKELLYAISAFEDVIYKGAVYSEEDLLALLKKMFGGDLDDSFGAKIKVENGAELKNAQERYEITVTLENAYWLKDGRYEEADKLTLKIKPKDVTVTLNAQECVYGQTATLDPTAFTVDNGGLCDGDSIELKLKFESETPHDAGTYNFVIEQGSNTNKNYNITNIAEAEGTFTVQKMEIEVTLPSYNREYNGNAPEVGDLAAATANKTLGYQDKLADLITLELNGATKDVGQYDVTAKIKGKTWENEDKNYKYAFTNGKYEITKKKVTVTADSQTSVFGDAIKPLTFKVYTLVEGEDINEYIKISTDATQGSPVGSNYTITVEWKDESRPKNYEVTQFTNGHYTIVAAGFGAITFDDVNVTYDGKPHTPSMKGAPEGASVTYKLKKGEEYTEPFTSATDAATYELQATVSLANYESQDITLTLTINKRGITVELPSKTRAYDGTVPQASELEPTLHAGSELGEGDELKDIVELSIENAAKDVKEYAVKGEQKAGATNYTVSFGNDGTYKITQAEVTVKINRQTKVYDGKDAELAQGEWEKTSGEWAKEEAPVIVLKFAAGGNVRNVGTYDIEGECQDGNYKVEFTDGKGAYSITKREITVKAEDKESTYGDDREQLTYTITGNEDITDGMTWQVKIECAVDKTTPYKEGGYPITVSVLNEGVANYEVREVSGTYTVNKRKVKVEIQDQSATYNLEGRYAFNELGWKLADGEALVNNDDLEITLKHEAFTNAGSYDITGESGNANYDVTFENGKYDIAKMRVEHNNTTVLFLLLVDGEEYQGTEVFPYVGEEFELTATVYVMEGDEFKQLEYTIDPEKMTEVKIYTVTVTINDVNYEGSRTFTVEVGTSEGFSQNLRDVLEELEKAVGEVTPDTLESTEEHFAMIKKVEAELAKLTESDKELGADRLSKYERLVEAWNDAASISEDVIDTAKTMADAPLKWLFALAETAALLCALYVIGKGGLM